MGCLKALITCALIASLAQAISMGGDALEDRQESCAQIHLLVARGSTEPPGDGQLGSLAARIIRAHQGATQEAIDYPALLNPYSTSVRAGTAAVLNQLTAYVRRCPNSMVVLLGYSQGAQIIGDALCGGDAAGAGPVTPPMDRNISDHVTAIVWYGDPRNVAGKPFDKGTATMNGIYGRPAAQSCDRFSNSMASYCDRGDPYCAQGANVGVHLTYPSRYDIAAATFVNQKLASPTVKF
ncbi:hypothetical protein PCL_06909 [Purpureocillium lilacinum]|uniref:CAZyme family CE5 n=1 Tax=Purpureocillium lilacinum TaxID=33203 RepID=A0A2U3DU00_PURLI|nr:CAZyme family CE5 [Purpureocillium lilacinum]PWI65704.1 hypothetical protein PCL_06909 [Purpureocillium lilacinum]